MNACFETSKPSNFEIGISLIEEHADSKIPSLEKVSESYEDLRPYMPKLGFNNLKEIRLNTATTALPIEGQLLDEG